MSGMLGLDGMTLAELQALRNQPGADQRKLAPYEHRAFAREWTADSPLVAAPSLTFAIPAYTAAKALGLQKARSPASLREMGQAYVGMLEGLLKKGRRY